MTRISLLGSTGSIGVNALDVIEHLRGRIEVVALAAGSNATLLAQQARKHSPQLVAIADEQLMGRLSLELEGTGIAVTGGKAAIEQAAAYESADMAVVAIVGASGLPASFAALSAGKTLALANKESLVMAGELLTTLAREKSKPIIPVDSEHSAIHQCLRCGEPQDVKRIVLTASGGPFRTFSRAGLDNATPEMALRHPTWNMGAKVTIDSATLMNKALEIIEAHWLFNMPAEKISVLVHPQSIIHSMVEFVDGTFIAQLGVPDMRGPIQYALTYPDRLPGRADTLNLAQMKSLTFEDPDTVRFPGLLLGWRAAREGGTSGTVLNAANEISVQLFLDRTIRFSDIARITKETMDRHELTHPRSVEDVLKADTWARATAQEIASTTK